MSTPAPKLRDCRFDEMGGAVWSGQINGHKVGLEARGEVHQLDGWLAGCRNDAHAFFCKRLSHGQPDTLTRTGDHCDLAAEM